MANETVTLTAELKDQMSAPLDKARQKVDGFTDAVVDGAKKQAAAHDRSTAQITNAVGKQNRLFGGMTGIVGRATQGTSRLFSGMASSIRRTLDGLPEYSSKQGEKTGNAFGNSFKSSMKLAAGAVATYFGAQMLGGYIKEAGAASDATDKFKATLNFAGLNTDAITKATADAKAYADQTVYDLPTIQNTFAQLASNGIKDYAGLTKAAGNLNAVAGGNAETFKSVSRTLTQAAGAGKLMTEDWNMLSDAIPGASGPLQEAMKEAGAFEGNFKKAMENGEITADEFNSALMKLGTKPVAVEAAKSTKTFEGALGNLNATINSKLMTALDKIKPAATNAINALAGGLGKALDWTGKAAQGLYDLFAKGDFGTAFREAFNVEEDSPLVDALFDIREAAMKLPDAAKKVWELREPIGVVAGLILTLLIPRFVQMGVEALKAAVKTRAAWAMTQGAAIKAQVINVIAAWQIIGGWVLMGAQAMIQAVRIAGAWLIAMGPVGWIIGIIALLVGAFVWAYNNVDWFRDGVDAAMKWVGEAVQNVGKWIVDVWNGVVDWWNQTLMPAIDAVGKWFSDVFTNIGNWFRDFIGMFVDGWNHVVNWWNSNIAPIIKGIGDVFAFVFDWVRRLIWNFATIVAALWQKAVDLWNGVLAPALQAVGKWFGDIFNWIWTYAIKPVIDFIAGGIQGLIDLWNGILLPAIQAVGKWFGDVFNWIWNTIIKPVIDFIVGGFNGLIDFWNLTLLPGLQALGDGFMVTMDWIWNTIIKPVIDFIVGGFNGLVDFWNGVLLPAVDAVGKWFSDIIGGAISGIGDFIEDLKKGFEGFISFWTQTLKPVVDTIADIFNSIGDAIGYALGKLGEFANNPLGGIQDWLGIQKDGNGQGKMPGASGGGVFGKFAGGGVLGGYAPGRDSILARLSPGESVLVPELTRAIGPQNIMAANAEASGGRPAGAGPSLVSGYSSNGRAGTTTMTNVAAGAVQITIHAGPNGVTASDVNQVRTAVESIFEEHNRRSY